MKSYRSIILLPFVLILALFLCDRLLNIPILQKRMRAPVSNMEILDAYTRLVVADQRRLEAQDPRPLIAFIGTSRALPFQILNRLQDDPFINTQQRAYLNQFRYEARFGAPLPDLLNYLMLADRLAEQNFRADTIVIDISPFVLYNPELVRRRWARNAYPEDFLWRQAWHFPDPLRSDAMGRLFFKTYHYHLQPTRFFEERAANRLDPSYGAQVYLDNPLPYAYHTRQDFSMDATYHPDQAPRFYQLTKIVVKDIFGTYDREMGMQPIFAHILRILEGCAEHIILWLPPTHPLMRKLVYQKLSKAPDAEEHFWQVFFQALHKSDAAKHSFVNGYEYDRTCNYWLDVSHISPRCYGLMTLKILRCRSNPNCVLPTGGLPMASD